MTLNKDSLDALEKMQNLRLLSISRTHGSELDLSQRPALLRRLKTIVLSKLSGSDTVHALSGSMNLERLELDQTGVTGTDLKLLAKNSNLRSILLKTSLVDGSMIDALVAIKSLRKISFDDALISSLLIKKLLKNLPELKELSLAGRSQERLDDELGNNSKIHKLEKGHVIVDFQ